MMYAGNHTDNFSWPAICFAPVGQTERRTLAQETVVAVWCANLFPENGILPTVFKESLASVTDVAEKTSMASIQWCTTTERGYDTISNTTRSCLIIRISIKTGEKLKSGETEATCIYAIILPPHLHFLRNILFAGKDRTLHVSSRK